MGTKSSFYGAILSAGLLLHPGFTEDTLRTACSKVQGGVHCGSEDLRDTLFACERQNRIQKVEWCRRGCIEEGSDGSVDDHCERAFTLQGKEPSIRIEI